MSTFRWTFAAIGIILLCLLAGCSSRDPVMKTQTAGTAPAQTSAPTASPLPPTLPTATPAAVPVTSLLSSPTPTGAGPTPAPTQPPIASAVPTQAPAAAGPTTTPAPRDCTDRMTFDSDVTVPDNTMFAPGETFTKTWRIYNSGTCTWDSSYQLAFANGDPLNGPMENPIPDAAPRQAVELSVSLVAPSQGGQYVSHWKLRNYAGQEFGVGVPPNIPLWVIINVSYYQAQNAALDDTGDDTQAGESGEVTQPAGEEAQCNAQQDASVPGQIIALVNAAREQNGLNALSESEALAAAARQHSLDMACSQNISHIGSDGSSWSDRVSAQGYSRPTTARENIYAGDPSFGATPQGAFDWWMNSQVHYDNIMWPDVADIGVGYAYYNGAGYYTLLVATP